jgi:hypothetical protein
VDQLGDVTFMMCYRNVWSWEEKSNWVFLLQINIEIMSLVSFPSLFSCL